MRKLRQAKPVSIRRDPLWFKNAVIYEVHVRAFCDSNADGVGDLPGLTSKLDFLQDLGVTALWLLPFYPSPLRDGGYDIADYTGIHPAYGTMPDFRELLVQAHARGIRVITELVINHTSMDHAWFQAARRAPPGSPARDFYVWSDTPARYKKTRIIFKDFETSNWAWDPLAKSYYWHRFYAHQPDLNFDNPAVHQAVFDAMDFWLDLGVDGLRLDAVPYLYERDGTDCENLPETHDFLRKLRKHVDEKYADRMLLAEANQWPVDAAAYFGIGDECHMNFHFPLMPRMFMAVQMEDRFPIVDILRQTPTIPESCQWATFLRNHDELTLEMVTDEERDYMYRVYTEDPVARINLGIRRRLAPLLKSRDKIELMTSLLFSLPGAPVLYYGDEIGMGDNVYLGDRDGVRTPMQWSSDRNAGFSRANPQRLYLPVIVDSEYHYEAVNVEAQQANPSSLLWWTKRLIALRKEHPAFGFGDLEILRMDNAKILAFTRSHDAPHRTEQLLVVANLSRFPQYVELELSAHGGKTPVEMFGRTRFPVITDRPYVLTLGPYGFFWFVLEPPATGGARERGSFAVTEAWTRVAEDRPRLARLLADFARERRWFRGKSRVQHGARVVELIEAHAERGRLLFVLFEIEYTDGEPETYFLPLGYAAGEPAVNLQQRTPHAVIANLEVTGAEHPRGVLYDALATGEAASVLLSVAKGRFTLPGELGSVTGTSSPLLVDELGSEVPAPRTLDLEQTNSTVFFGEQVVLKVFRQVERGINAEIEIGDYFTRHAPSVGVPAVLGSVSYQLDGGPSSSIAVVHDFVPNEGLAWDLFTREVEKLFQRVLTENEGPPPSHASSAFDMLDLEPPAFLRDNVGQHFRRATELGRRTAEMHAALSAGLEPEFVPEPFTVMHQQSLFQRTRSLLIRTFEALARGTDKLPEGSRIEARRILSEQKLIEDRLRRVMAKPLEACRIRCHGDLHLGQILFTGDAFIIVDFEGEPARPLGERRYKRCALRDVAGMLRSFTYASEACLRGGSSRQQDEPRLRPWGTAWASWVGAAYLQSYIHASQGFSYIPASAPTLSLLLDFYMMEKAIYEIGYELNHRPDWLPIPIRGLLELSSTVPPEGT